MEAFIRWKVLQQVEGSGNQNVGSDHSYKSNIGIQLLKQKWDQTTNYGRKQMPECQHVNFVMFISGAIPSKSLLKTRC